MAVPVADNNHQLDTGAKAGDNDATSLSTRKRASTEPAPEERSNKKPKDSSSGSTVKDSHSTGEETHEAASDSDTRKPSPLIDKNTWQGFCKIESDPAYFSVILREMGVSGMTVREVFGMDQDSLQSTLPQPIYGLILVFHYREFGTADEPTSSPEDVWFANQLPAQDSCATLAMMNILMNNTDEDISIGEHLTQFKDFTKDMTPYQRGEAYASFDFVKRIHNSFAKRMDMLESDKYLSHRVRKARATKQQSEEVINANNDSGSTTKRSGTRRTARAESTASDESAGNYEDNAFHFISFLPMGNEVWKLDGMDRQPVSMGTFDVDKGETWLGIASETITSLMAAGDDDYGVIALTQSPLISLRSRASRTFASLYHVEARLDTLEKDWRAFLTSEETDTASDADILSPPDPSLLGISTTSTTITDSLLTAINAEDVPTLLSRRTLLLGTIFHLCAEISAEIQIEADQDAKAEQRRFDYGPVIQRWLEMLAENGYLEEHLGRFMSEGAGNAGRTGTRKMEEMEDEKEENKSGAEGSRKGR